VLHTRDVAKKTPVRTRGGVQPTKIQPADIAAAALEIVERSGLDGLTVKAVADHMGVTSPAIYYYLPGGRDELTALVATRVIDTLAPKYISTDLDGDWFEVLLDVLSVVGEVAQRYPGVIPYLMDEGRELPANVATTGFIVAQLARGGFDGEAAAMAYGAIYAFVSGWASATPVSSHAASEAELPQLAEVLRDLEQSSPSHRLRIGLTALIRGLQTKL
jgi:TetR/AcrR family transcriptional regulator, tetracycline repressor protein